MEKKVLARRTAYKSACLPDSRECESSFTRINEHVLTYRRARARPFISISFRLLIHLANVSFSPQALSPSLSLLAFFSLLFAFLLRAFQRSLAQPLDLFFLDSVSLVSARLILLYKRIYFIHMSRLFFSPPLFAAPKFCRRYCRALREYVFSLFSFAENISYIVVEFRGELWLYVGAITFL